MNTLTLIRGVPGSGKSTLAKRLTVAEGAQGMTTAHYEADMFHMDSQGNYNWRPERVKEAHEWCLNATLEAMGRGVERIFVANTFVKQWEMTRYREIAESYGYGVVEIICHNDFGSIHDVPIETIERMKRNFEYRG